MDRKDRTTEHCSDNREQSFYQTGSTRPPKSRDGLIAVVLAAVIFLGGIFSILSLLKIRLFRQFNSAENSATPYIQFSQDENAAASASENVDSVVPDGPDIGFAAKNISSFDRTYYRLPEGVYITQVDKNSDACQKGIVSGDILLQFDTTRITDVDALGQLLRSHNAGDEVTLVIYRNGMQRTLTIILDESR